MTGPAGQGGGRSAARQFHELSWQDASRWWPWPLLRHPTGAEGWVETVYLWDDEPPERLDPKRDDEAELTIFYGPPGVNLNDYTWGQAKNAGAFELRVKGWQAERLWTRRETWLSTTEPSTVRGHPARVMRHVPNPDRQDDPMLWLVWEEPQSDGYVQVFLVNADPISVSDKGIVAWANRLTDVPD